MSLSDLVKIPRGSSVTRFENIVLEVEAQCCGRGCVSVYYIGERGLVLADIEVAVKKGNGRHCKYYKHNYDYRKLSPAELSPTLNKSFQVRDGDGEYFLGCMEGEYKRNIIGPLTYGDTFTTAPKIDYYPLKMIGQTFDANGDFAGKIMYFRSVNKKDILDMMNAYDEVYQGKNQERLIGIMD